MFGKSRREIEALQRDLEAVQGREQAAHEHIARLEGALSSSEAQSADYRVRVEFFEELVKHLYEFGESTKSVQTSMAAMAQALRNETQEAVKATGETAHSQQTVRRLTEHIGGEFVFLAVASLRKRCFKLADNQFFEIMNIHNE